MNGPFGAFVLVVGSFIARSDVGNAFPATGFVRLVMEV